MANDAVAKPIGFRKPLERVTIRFAGDSGDGVQLTGTQFTTATAIAGNDLATLPDFPAEIRAPAGTIPGVSGFQIQFSSSDIHTPGDQPDLLVVFNPAALKLHIQDLPINGVLIVDTAQFDKAHLTKAGYSSNPLEDGSLNKYRVFAEDITGKTSLTTQEVSDLTVRERQRSKNFFALGMAYWLFNRPIEPTLRWVEQKFKKLPSVMKSNILALKGGYAYCEMTEAFQTVAYEVPPAPAKPGKYRNLSGNEALAMGLVAASVKSGRQLFYGAYPITPASDILHELSRHKNFGVITFQAEDEIAAMASVVGASYAGSLAVTASAGPGFILKQEALGLAVMTELPVVVIDVQRGGPSTGLPTKTEQSDLLAALYGRHGEAPLIILAPSTPGECFHLAYQACRLAMTHMTPVVLLSDGYLANGAEPWLIPDADELPPIEVSFAQPQENFQPYKRDRKLVRPWAIPGTPRLEHRIGGLEKRENSGAVAYDPENHERMTALRAEKVNRVAEQLPLQAVIGPEDTELLVVGWGSTYGAIRAGIELAAAKGIKVAHAQIQYLNPFPRNLEQILRSYTKILCPEMNMGQLSVLLRDRFALDVVRLNKVQGQPFKAQDILEGIEATLAGKPVRSPITELISTQNSSIQTSGISEG